MTTVLDIIGSYAETPLDALRKARLLLSDKKRWTQHTFARDANGLTTAFWHPSACCWCAEGAVRLVTQPGHPVPRATPSALLTLSAVVAGREVREANDRPSTTHTDVLRWFDKAIARLEEQG